MRSGRLLGRPLVAWWPPIAAWLAVTAGVLLVSFHEGWPPFAPVTTWSRADSLHYRTIARAGYTLFRCRSHTYPAGSWCGDAGWFPAYPWIVGGIERLGLPLAATALAVSWLASLATVVLLWRAFLVRLPWPQGLLGLAYAAVAPGLVYDYAVFPLSLLCLCTVAAFALLRAERLLAAGLAAALAALAYPIGLALAPASVAWLLLERSRSGRARLGRAARVGLPTVAALGLYALDQRLETGRWDAYLLVQRKYGHGLHDPFAALASDARGVVDGSAFHLAGAPALQSLLVAFVLICVLALVLSSRAGSSPTGFESIVALWAVCAWLLAHVWESVSVYRGEAALLPLALLVARLPRPLAFVLAGAACLLVIPMELLYERSILV